jgi:hypothetical protein
MGLLQIRIRLKRRGRDRAEDEARSLSVNLKPPRFHLQWLRTSSSLQTTSCNPLRTSLLTPAPVFPAVGTAVEPEEVEDE